MNELFPSHVVAEWLGYSVKITENRYLQVTEEHRAKALNFRKAKTSAENKGFPEIAGGFSEKSIKNQSSFESGKHELKPLHGGCFFGGG
ncbi:MAG: hypothetical protein LBJ67_16090 [Planctomycetaceae bacterium]|nr:hypothetical protein [Planctomycetaceae bacterium]